MAPTGSNHQTFREELAMAPKAMAPRLLMMSFLWSSASASIESAAGQKLTPDEQHFQAGAPRQMASRLQRLAESWSCISARNKATASQGLQSAQLQEL